MTGRARFSIACVAALALLAGAYSNSLRNTFHFDDTHVVVQNLFIRDLANIPRFFTDARTFSSLPQNAVYRPMVSATLAIDYHTARGLDPLPYHVTQLVLLVALGALLVLLYRGLLLTTDDVAPAPWGALFAATLFCVHTANTQAANYISARSELISALGVVGGFLLYTRSELARRTHAYLLPVVAGALGKNLAVMFAPLLLAYKLLVEQQLALADLFASRSWPQVRRAVLSSLPAFVVCAALFVFIERMNPPGQSYGGGTRGAYLATQAWMWVRYLGMYFVPVGLTADTDYGLFAGFDPRIIAGIVALAGTIALAAWASRSRRWRPVAFGIAWFWIALVPTSSIVPLAEVTNDHRMFFPYIGLNIAVVWLAWRAVATALARAGRAAWTTRFAGVGAMAVLAAHAIGTFERNKVWRTDETLWRDVSIKSPRNGRGLMNYGLSQMRLGRYLEARQIFESALRYSPNYSFLEVNLGIVNAALQDQVEAERHFLRAIQLDEPQPSVHRYYATWLLERGRGPEARRELERLLQLTAGDADARRELMAIEYARGDTAGVAALARTTLAIDRTDAAALAYLAGRPPLGGGGAGAAADASAWYRIAISLTNSQRHLDAAQAYRAATAVDPRNADAWNNLGWTLGVLGFYTDAIVPLERALALRPNYQLARNNLVWVRDQAGRQRGT